MRTGKISEGIVERIRIGWRVDLLEFGEDVLRRRREDRGLTQEDIARTIGVDQSRVSRIESGQPGRLDFPAAKAIALAYQLDDEETDAWLQLLFGIPMTPPPAEANYDDLIKEFEDHCETIYQVRAFKGECQLAAVRAHVLTNRISLVLKGVPASQCQPLAKVLLRASAEKGWASSTASLPGELWIDKAFVNGLYFAAKEYGVREFLGLSAHFLGDAYFIVREHATSMQWLKEAHEYEENPYYLLHLHRTMALNWAFLKEPEKCQAEVQKTISIIKEGRCTSLERICETYDGLARSQGYVGLSEAFDTLKEGKDYYAQMQSRGETAPIKYAQLVRAELDLAEIFQPKLIQSLEGSAKEARDLVRDKCPRLAWQIDKLLDSTLN